VHSLTHSHANIWYISRSTKAQLKRLSSVQCSGVCASWRTQFGTTAKDEEGGRKHEMNLSEPLLFLTLHTYTHNHTYLHQTVSFLQLSLSQSAALLQLAWLWSTPEVRALTNHLAGLCHTYEVICDFKVLHCVR